MLTLRLYPEFHFGGSFWHSSALAACRSFRRLRICTWWKRSDGPSLEGSAAAFAERAIGMLLRRRLAVRAKSMILHKGRPCELATSSVDALQIASHSSWWSDHVHSPQFQFPRGFQHPLDARRANAEHLAMTVVPRPCASFLIMLAAIEPLPALVDAVGFGFSYALVLTLAQPGTATSPTAPREFKP
jgi:hypothetical protein